MKHLIVFFTLQAATGLAIDHSLGMSSRGLHGISTNPQTRGSDDRDKTMHSRQMTPVYNRLGRRVSKDSMGVPPPTRPSSPSIPGTEPIPRANPRLQASLAPSSSRSSGYTNTHTRQSTVSFPRSSVPPRNLRLPKSALTAEIQHQKAIADHVYAQIPDPKKKMAALEEYSQSLGIKPPVYFKELSPKHAAASHHAVALDLANRGGRDAAAFSRLHAVAAVEAARQASGSEVGSAQKYAIGAHEHADRAIDRYLPFSRPPPPIASGENPARPPRIRTPRTKPLSSFP